MGNLVPLISANRHRWLERGKDDRIVSAAAAARADCAPGLRLAAALADKSVPSDHELGW